MKHRTFNTNLWSDSYISKLESDELNLFIFLFTNNFVTKCGLYELPDKFILSFIKITPERLNEIKKKFEFAKKYYFYEDWIYISNFSKHNIYSPTIYIAESLKKEFNLIPKNIREYFFGNLKLKPHLSFTEGKDFNILFKKNRKESYMLYVICNGNSNGYNGQGGGHVLDKEYSNSKNKMKYQMSKQCLEDIDPDEIPI